MVIGVCDFKGHTELLQARIVKHKEYDAPLHSPKTVFIHHNVDGRGL